jgi:type I restriction enzyme M protein
VQRANPVINKVPKPLVKAFISAFGVRDPGGDVVSRDGVMVPDDELTDYESVPLGVDVHDYLANEVLPHAPDAFIDENFRDEADGQLGVVGYPFQFIP